MFKKNPNRPPMVVSLKRIQGGYKVIPNEGHAIFQVKRIIRTMYRPDLVPQGTALGLQQNGMSIPSTIIQPPSHFTFPAFASWFSLSQIHQIQKDSFPEFFQQGNQEAPFSFGVRNAKLYRYYRNTMVGMWLENVKKHLSAAHCRRTLAGDVSMIVRIHGFLENWGLINFPSRQHSKGIQVKPAERLTCYVCEESEEEIYHVAPIEDVIFQLCDNCFREGLYPSEMKEEEFVQVMQKNYKQNKNRLMNRSQILRLLEVLSSYANSKEKQKDMWAAAQKEFSQFTREELVYNFLRGPTVSKMNANIFDNNEDVFEESEPQEPPTVFEDFQNPLQTAIAVAYYRSKKEEDPLNKISPIFDAAEKHSRTLALVQQQKIEQLIKMLLDVSFSKLQLKSIFIQEYEKLVGKCLLSQRSTVANTLAETLKANLRFVERIEEPEVMEQSFKEEC